MRSPVDVEGPHHRAAWPYYWRVRRTLPERHGDPCRVLVRGKRNSALVEFTDGTRVVASRWAVRRRR